MSIKQILKFKFTEEYLLLQDKKWVRVFDASAAVLCFASAVIALYLLRTHPVGKLPTVANIVVWTYLVSSLPLGWLLYKQSNLKKYERFLLVLFILASSMNLLFSVMSVFVKT